MPATAIEHHFVMQLALHQDEAAVTRRMIAVGRGDARVLRVRRFFCGGGNRLSGLCGTRRHRKQGGDDESAHLKMDFGILTWTPIVPSTSWVMATSPARLVS